MPVISPSVFSSIYEERVKGSHMMWRQESYRGSANRARKFRSHFGCDAHHCALLWRRLQMNSLDGLKGWKPAHLLDALFFLKVYASEGVGSCFAKCDEKTLRKWNWTVIEAIANLDCVRAHHFPSIYLTG